MKNIPKIITISELSRITNLSRPTLYKYIDAYDNGEYELISDEYKDLFKYIEDEAYCKDDIYFYCMNKFEVSSKKGIMDQVKIIYDSNSSFKSYLDYIVQNSGKLDFKELLENIKGEM